MKMNISVPGFLSKPVTRRWILLTGFVFAINLVGLGSHGLLEPDEGRYTNMALEFLDPAHDWAEPMLSDVGHFDKPPLIYWVTGGSLSLFGMSEFSARLPSFLGSLLSLFGVFLLTLRQYGERAAWWAVMVCATSLHFWCLSHLISPDMLMCGFCTLGAGLVLWGGSQFRGWILWFLGVICWSLAWWTKATPALVPLGAITAALLLTGRWGLLARLRPLRLVSLILLLGSPWYIVMMNRHEELVDFFLKREIVGRIVGHEEGRTGFPGFHFAVALGFWLPWWPVLTLHAWKQWKTWVSLKWSARLRSLPWEPIAAVFVLVIFSFVSSKLITYTLPGIPLLAVGIGALLSSTSFSFRNRYGWVTVSNVITFAVILLGIHRLESSLGRNSSTREAAEIVLANGAQWVISDRFLPGLEFYVGEGVWYVDAKDIRQVKGARGQDYNAHFVDSESIRERVRKNDRKIWLIQNKRETTEWMRELIAEGPNPNAPPIEIGDFKLWQIK